MNNDPVLQLLRYSQNDKATLGHILYQNVRMCSTLELPWENNKQFISCIPEGKYKCITRFSPRFKQDLWLLLNVPGHDNIEIHPGNFVMDTKGCILVGNKIEYHKDYPVANNSQQTLSRLKALMPKEFWLEVKCDGFSNLIN